MGYTYGMGWLGKVNVKIDIQGKKPKSIKMHRHLKGGRIGNFIFKKLIKKDEFQKKYRKYINESYEFHAEKKLHNYTIKQSNAKHKQKASQPQISYEELVKARNIYYLKKDLAPKLAEIFEDRTQEDLSERDIERIIENLALKIGTEALYKDISLITKAMQECRIPDRCKTNLEMADSFNVDPKYQKAGKILGMNNTYAVPGKAAYGDQYLTIGELIEYNNDQDTDFKKYSWENFEELGEAKTIEYLSWKYASKTIQGTHVNTTSLTDLEFPNLRKEPKTMKKIYNQIKNRP